LTASLAQWMMGAVLIFSSLGIILARKPVHACLSFLLTLLTLAGLYLQQSAQFIAVMQILVYAGTILVIFMFVIVLFQDAHMQIERNPPKSFPFLLMTAAGAFVLALLFLGRQLMELKYPSKPLPKGYGSVESLGQALYVDFFLPFEVVILLFLVALVGALYVAKKEK
jgi:NADH-quinone oxidoreductase subunit J